MDSTRKYTEVNASYEGCLYTFDSDFVHELMRLDLYTSIPIVMMIERYVDQNYTISPDGVMEVAGAIKRKKPYFFVVVISRYDDIIFESLHKITSDEYLDYLIKNQTFN